MWSTFFSRTYREGNRKSLKNIVMIFELCSKLLRNRKSPVQPPEMACRGRSAQNLALFIIFFPRARFLRAIVRRPFYSGLTKESRGELKIRNASGIWGAISRYTSPVNEIHLHCDKCPRALAGIDSYGVTELMSNVKFYVLRFPPLNRIRIFCFDTTWNLWEPSPYGCVIKLY